ncbi:MAG: hypothetical protein V4692_05880 [Bdellovibrionota bacterium]
MKNLFTSLAILTLSPVAALAQTDPTPSPVVTSYYCGKFAIKVVDNESLNGVLAVGTKVTAFDGYKVEVDGQLIKQTTFGLIVPGKRVGATGQLVLTEKYTPGTIGLCTRVKCEPSTMPETVIEAKFELGNSVENAVCHAF